MTNQKAKTGTSNRGQSTHTKNLSFGETCRLQYAKIAAYTSLLGNVDGLESIKIISELAGKESSAKFVSSLAAANAFLGSKWNAAILRNTIPILTGDTSDLSACLIAAFTSIKEYERGVGCLRSQGDMFAAKELCEAGIKYYEIAGEHKKAITLSLQKQDIEAVIAKHNLVPKQPQPKTSMTCIKCSTTLSSGIFCPNCSSGELLFPLTNGLFDENYKIISQIGKGAIGAVYKAQHKDLNIYRAIKALLPSEEYTENDFRREATILSNLNHPKLPKVHDFKVKDKKGFLIMEFIDGNTLEDVLEESLKKHKKPLEEKTVVDYALQLCEILEYLHAQQPPVIFRDIKARNVMITNGSNDIKLVDFGIAKFLASDRTGTNIGTPGYAPPEQYAGKAEPRSDIYALGVLMHYLLTGRKPEENPFSFPLLRTLNHNISEGVEQIVRKAAELNHEMRFRTANEMRQTIEACKNGQKLNLYDSSIADNSKPNYSMIKSTINSTLSNSKQQAAEVNNK